MFTLPKSVRDLIEAFERLPGIGPKTARRLAFYLLAVPQTELEKFASSLTNLKKLTKICSICFNVGNLDPCLICSDPSRDKGIICVVEQAIDIISIERTGKYAGVYHVLGGALNPLVNIGPEEIRIDELLKRVKEGKIREVILATNLGTEGEATAMFLKKQLIGISQTFDPAQGKQKIIKNLKITRIAHGLPLGADVQYADEYTLKEAMEGRREY